MLSILVVFCLSSLQVTGMTCSSCVHLIERTLRGTNGVEKATVALTTNRCHVEFDPIEIGPRDIIEVIKVIIHFLLKLTTGQLQGCATFVIICYFTLLVSSLLLRVLVLMPALLLMRLVQLTTARLSEGVVYVHVTMV